MSKTPGPGAVPPVRGGGGPEESPGHYGGAGAEGRAMTGSDGDGLTPEPTQARRFSRGSRGLSFEERIAQARAKREALLAGQAGPKPGAAAVTARHPGPDRAHSDAEPYLLTRTPARKNRTINFGLLALAIGISGAGLWALVRLPEDAPTRSIGPAGALEVAPAVASEELPKEVIPGVLSADPAAAVTEGEGGIGAAGTVTGPAAGIETALDEAPSPQSRGSDPMPATGAVSPQGPLARLSVASLRSVFPETEPPEIHAPRGAVAATFAPAQWLSAPGPVEGPATMSTAAPGTEHSVVPRLRPASISEGGGTIQPAEPVAPFAARISLHAPNSLAEATVSAEAQTIAGLGYELRARRLIDFSISQRQVRYFHASDAATAAVLAAGLGAIVRDFTDFRPLPLEGTLEVWMEGVGQPERPEP